LVLTDRKHQNLVELTMQLNRILGECIQDLQPLSLLLTLEDGTVRTQFVLGGWLFVVCLRMLMDFTCAAGLHLLKLRVILRWCSNMA
jgi:hypothetical protein